MDAKNCERADEPVEHNPERLRALVEHAPKPRARHLYGGTPAAFTKAAFLLLLVCAGYSPRAGNAEFLCASCELQVGVGGTHDYWTSTGSLVLPVTLTWDQGRYEFGVFRFTGTQLIPAPGTHRERLMANPYWGASLSRRWQIFERGPIKGFLGFGLAARTESDELSSTRWDFSSQLGLRFPLPGDRVIAEASIRHWSNGGVKQPNRGQDFAILTIRLNSKLFGIGNGSHSAIDPSFTRESLLTVNEFGLERRALP